MAQLKSTTVTGDLSVSGTITGSIAALSGLTASIAELNHCDGVTSNIQTQLNNRLPLSGGTMTGSIITPKDNSMGIIPHTNNYGQIGSSDKKFYRMYATTFNGDLNGKSSSSDLLALHNTITSNSTRSISASGWDGAISGVNYVWGQSFKDTSISSDTGDLVLALRPGQYSSGSTELCMAIDGDYYALGNKVLHAGNWSSYCAAASHGTHVGSKYFTSGYESAFRTQMKGNSSNGQFLTTIRTDSSLSNAAPYGAGIAFGEGDTHGYLDINYSTPQVFIGGGNANKLNWIKTISFTDHSHSLSSLGLKFTTIVANGSAATSASWTNNAYDFFIGCVRPASSNTPACFSMAANHCADVQVTDEVQCTVWTTTGTGMTRKSGSGTIFGLWGVNVV